MKIKKGIHFYACLLLLIRVCSYTSALYAQQEHAIPCQTQTKTWPLKVGDFLIEAAKDVLYLHKNLFHVDTFKIGVATFPFYVFSAMFDDKVHKLSYCRNHHTNLCQMHHSLHKFAVNYSVGAVSVFVVAAFLFSHNERLRQTSLQFMIGVPFVIMMSDFIKFLIKSNMCYRPWNQRFNGKNRCFGGFPSTHAAQLSYATFLFGLQHGARAAYPLALLTIFVGLSCFNGNRHYVSQYIAGAGLGAIYAFASSKIVDAKFAKDIVVGVDTTMNGNPAIKVGFNF